ncbi:MAG: oligosaccharide flippase family protein [bacterium]|nr:oligosaccharide flippase family protein [bacterium]
MNHAPTENTQKPKDISVVGKFALGNQISTILRFIGGLLQARFVFPEVLGKFNSITMILEYVSMSELGIISALGREYPYHIGKGEKEKGLALAATALYWSLLLTIVSGLIMLILSGYYFWRGDAEMGWGFIANVFTAFYLYYSISFLAQTYRTSHQFVTLAKITVTQNVLTLVFLVFVYWYGFYGLLIRAVLSAISYTIMVYRWRPIRVLPKWNWDHLKHLSKVGFPIFLMGQLYARWTTINSTVVLWLAGQRSLGLYAIVVTFTGSLEILPNAIAQVFYPKLSEEYGKSNDPLKLLSMMKKPILISFGLITALCVLVFPILPYIIRFLLPKYVDATLAAQFGLLIAIVDSGTTPMRTIFNVIRRQDLFFYSILSGVIAYLLAVLSIYPNISELYVFALSMAFGRGVMLLTAYLFLQRIKRKALRLRQSQ